MLPMSTTEQPVLPPAPSILPSTTAPAARGLDSLMIVSATLAHVPYLRRLKEAVMHDRYRPAPDEAGFAAWRDLYCTDAYFEAIIANPDALLLAIGTLREPVGMVVLRRGDDDLEVDDLLVLTPRQGDGTRLLVAALRYAEVWRSRRVFIDVYPNHDSTETFLEAHGFADGGEVTNDLGRPMRRFARTVHT